MTMLFFASPALFSSLYLDHRVPARALEAVDHAVLAKSHGRQLEEIPAHDHLDAAETAVIPADPARNGFQLVEETAVQHRDL